MNLLGVLGIALSLSLAANAGLFYLRDQAVKEGATAVQAAELCSTGVKKLRQETEKRQTALEIAFKNAQEQAKSDLQRAKNTNKSLPKDMSNMCLSADLLSQEKIAERKAQ